MKLHYFLNQNHQQRAAWTQENGKLLMDRKSGIFTIYLYAINAFFVEIWYRETDKEIELTRGFRSTSLLAPYLEMIDLVELVSN